MLCPAALSCIVTNSKVYYQQRFLQQYGFTFTFSNNAYIVRLFCLSAPPSRLVKDEFVQNVQVEGNGGPGSSPGAVDSATFRTVPPSSTITTPITQGEQVGTKTNNVHVNKSSLLIFICVNLHFQPVRARQDLRHSPQFNIRLLLASHPHFPTCLHPI